MGLGSESWRKSSSQRNMAPHRDHAGQVGRSQKPKFKKKKQEYFLSVSTNSGTLSRCWKHHSNFGKHEETGSSTDRDVGRKKAESNFTRRKTGHYGAVLHPPLGLGGQLRWNERCSLKQSFLAVFLSVVSCLCDARDSECKVGWTDVFNSHNFHTQLDATTFLPQQQGLDNQFCLILSGVLKTRCASPHRLLYTCSV